jgi:hypothetical protein
MLSQLKVENVILKCAKFYSELGKRIWYCDPLGAGRSGDRIPVGVIFSGPVQTRPGAHSAFYAMSTGSFPGVKRPG